jgi:hypothetical protein
VSRHVILFLAANPRATTQLALDEECAAIEREFRMHPFLDDFDFQSRWAVSVYDVARHAHELQPAIIHFSGDGSGSAKRRTQNGEHYNDTDATLDAGIYLQSERTGQAQWACAGTLGGLLPSAAPWFKGIVLNRCFNDFVAELLRSRWVVGMDGAVSNDISHSFAVAFYRALGNRPCSIGNTVEQAIAFLADKRLPDEHLPALRTWASDSSDQIFLPNPYHPHQ